MKYLGGGLAILALWAWLITGLAMMRYRDFATRWPRWARWEDRVSRVLLPASAVAVVLYVSGLIVLAWMR